MSETSIGIVVVTHGQLATELLNAAEIIVGELPQFVAVSIGWHDGVEVARGPSRRRSAGGSRKGVLLLTDMFGGTPSTWPQLLEAGRVDGGGGVNLPMLIRLAKPRRRDLQAIARELCDHGRAAIRVASDLLQGERPCTP